MKRIFVSLVGAMGLLAGIRGEAVAVPVLWESHTVGGVLNDSAFDYDTGLGEILLSFAANNGSAPVQRYAGVWVDHEVNEETNSAFNEYGSRVGSPDAGQSWEIDEPGWNPRPADGQYGDIYDNFVAHSLDNGNGVPIEYPFDVAMALGWDFSLLVGEKATARFVVSLTAPSVAFYLVQTDPESQQSLYFSSELTKSPAGDQVVPEPGTLVLLCSGLLGLAGWRRRSVRR